MPEAILRAKAEQQARQREAKKQGGGDNDDDAGEQNNEDKRRAAMRLALARRMKLGKHCFCNDLLKYNFVLFLQ